MSYLGWFSRCCCYSFQAEAPPIPTVNYFALPTPEKDLAWMRVIVKRQNLSDFQRLQRRTITVSKGDVSRFFRCRNMDVAADRLADEWNSLLYAMLPKRFSAPILAGTGGQGIVLVAKDTENDQKVALKHVYFGNRKLLSYVRICREIQIGKFCDHPNICKMQEVLSSETSDNLTYVICVFEEVHTTLSEVLKNCPLNPRPSHRTASEWIYRLLSAVQYLHERDIIHRDLKPSNIGLTLTREPASCQFKENFCNMVKLLDMGMARGMSGDRPLTPALGTYSYMAPELLLNNHIGYCSQSIHQTKQLLRPVGIDEATSGFSNYSNSIDIWAVGAMFAEILIADGSKLFSSQGLIKPCEMLRVIAKTIPMCNTPEYCDYVGESNAKFLQEIKESPPANKSIDHCLPDNLLPQDDDVIDNLNGNNAKDLLKRMLKWNPKERITAREALQHPYFLHLTSEMDILPSSRKYKETLPSTGYNDNKLPSEVDPVIVQKWEETIYAELNWKRDEITDIN